MKVFLLVFVVVVFYLHLSNLKENSESFNKGLERIEELKEIITE